MILVHIRLQRDRVLDLAKEDALKLDRRWVDLLVLQDREPGLQEVLDVGVALELDVPEMVDFEKLALIKTRRIGT